MEIGASGETCWPFFVDLTVNTSYTSAMTEQEASRQSLSNEINGIASHLYTAYCDSVGGKAFNGDPLPDWATFSRDQSKQKQVKAWLDVAGIADFMARNYPSKAATFQERLSAELDDTTSKVAKLSKFIDSPKFKTLSESQQRLQRRQLSIMASLADVLHQRIMDLSHGVPAPETAYATSLPAEFVTSLGGDNTRWSTRSDSFDPKPAE